MGACCGSAPKATRDNPVIVGPDEGPVRHVLPSVNLTRMRSGEPTWARGAHVQTMVDAGWLTLLDE